MTWDELKRAIPVGTIITGRVTSHESYGVFMDIGYEYKGLIQITDFKDEGRMTPEEYPGINCEVRAKVLAFRDNDYQIWFGVRPSQLQS